VEQEARYDSIYPPLYFEELMDKHLDLKEDIELWFDEYDIEERPGMDPRKSPEDFQQT
jgi:hypothetical protein